MDKEEIKLVPYLYFNGNCEQTFETYKKIFNGLVEIAGRWDQPEMNASENYKNKVLHARLHFGDNMIMASDASPDLKMESGENIVLSLGFKDVERTHQIFNELAKNGKITRPLKKQFWGGLFDEVTDCFGIRWMLNCDA